MPFSMAEVVNDPDFAQAFSITRSTGQSVWLLGKWVNVTVPVSGWGVIQPATEQELEQVPEGDRVRGSISIHTSQPIYETNLTGISDKVIWNGQAYRVVKLYPWQDFGYYKAVLCRMSGE